MSRIVITRARLFDGENEPRPDTSIVVSGNRIESVRAGAASEVDARDRVIDANGMTVMPGMVLAHFHAQFHDVGEGGRMGFYTGSERPVGVQMVNCVNAGRNALFSGFTSIVGAGCTDHLDFQLRMAIEEGLCEGPRVLPASHILETTGYEGDTVPWWREQQNKGTYRFADGPDELRKLVRTEIRFGAQIIKIQPAGGHGYPASSGQGTLLGEADDRPPFRYIKMSRDEVAAVVEAAHQKGKKVRAHVAWRDSILQCVELGVDLIDHGDELDSECIGRMAEAACWWTPSIIYLRRLADNPAAADTSRASVQRDYENVMSRVAEADEAGVRVVIGDDWGVPGLMPHEPGCYVEELELYVRDAGVKPTTALRWATKNGGLLMHGPDLGVVREGALADLLVVDGDPTSDLGCLRRPAETLKLIMKDGVIVKDAA